ncbi:hypothetical protein JCM19992_24150 [Thermostilla marina]
MNGSSTNWVKIAGSVVVGGVLVLAVWVALSSGWKGDKGDQAWMPENPAPDAPEAPLWNPEAAQVPATTQAESPESLGFAWDAQQSTEATAEGYQGPTKSMFGYDLPPGNSWGSSNENSGVGTVPPTAAIQGPGNELTPAPVNEAVGARVPSPVGGPAAWSDPSMGGQGPVGYPAPDASGTGFAPEPSVQYPRTDASAGFYPAQPTLAQNPASYSPQAPDIAPSYPATGNGPAVANPQGVTYSQGSYGYPSTTGGYGQTPASASQTWSADTAAQPVYPQSSPSGMTGAATYDQPAYRVGMRPSNGNSYGASVSPQRSIPSTGYPADPIAQPTTPQVVYPAATGASSPNASVTPYIPSAPAYQTPVGGYGYTPQTSAGYGAGAYPPSGEYNGYPGSQQGTPASYPGTNRYDATRPGLY